jgi:hypothetical protein
VPSLEQIIRPFVVDPTTPPVPYVTTLNEEPPDLVRLDIGIGRTRVTNRRVPKIDPIDPIDDRGGGASMEKLSSSYSISVQFYHDEDVKEQRQAPESSGGG